MISLHVDFVNDHMFHRNRPYNVYDVYTKCANQDAKDEKKAAEKRKRTQIPSFSIRGSRYILHQKSSSNNRPSVGAFPPPLNATNNNNPFFFQR